MKILLLDDEPILLAVLEKTVKSVLPQGEIAVFGSSAKALEYAEKEPVDIAFLDIQLPGQSGITVAKKLTERRPRLNVIFVTGYTEYALDAHEVYCSGYLLKPVTEEKVREALGHLRYPVAEDAPLLTLRRGEHFEALDKFGAPLVFRRNRARDLLAFLAACGARGATTAEVLDALYPDGGDEAKRKRNHTLLRQVASALGETLKEAGAESVLMKRGEAWVLNSDRIAFEEVNPEK